MKIISSLLLLILVGFYSPYSLSYMQSYYPDRCDVGSNGTKKFYSNYLASCSSFGPGQCAYSVRVGKKSKIWYACPYGADWNEYDVDQDGLKNSDDLFPYDPLNGNEPEDEHDCVSGQTREYIGLDIEPAPHDAGVTWQKIGDSACQSTATAKDIPNSNCNIITITSNGLPATDVAGDPAVMSCQCDDGYTLQGNKCIQNEPDPDPDICPAGISYSFEVVGTVQKTGGYSWWLHDGNYCLTYIARDEIPNSNCKNYTLTIKGVDHLPFKSENPTFESCQCDDGFFMENGKCIQEQEDEDESDDHVIDPEPSYQTTVSPLYQTGLFYISNCQRLMPIYASPSKGVTFTNYAPFFYQTPYVDCPGEFDKNKLYTVSELESFAKANIAPVDIENSRSRYELSYSGSPYFVSTYSINISYQFSFENLTDVKNKSGSRFVGKYHSQYSYSSNHPVLGRKYGGKILGSSGPAIVLTLMGEGYASGNNDDDSGNGSGSGKCDPKSEGYLDCMDVVKESDRFTGYTSLEDDIEDAKAEYQDKVEEILEDFKDKIDISVNSDSPFYSDKKEIMGVEVEFGTVIFQDALAYAPAIILLMAGISSSVIVLRGYKS